MLSARRAGRGFSLIELMVVITVGSLLMLAAMPTLGTWIADAQVRTSADALQNAVRLAQAEALRRSRTAVLVLTSDAPQLDATPVANGTRWVVRLLARDTDSSEETASLFVRGGTEPASHGVNVNGPALVCFNALGQQSTLGESATGLDAACTAPTDGGSPSAYILSRSGTSRSLKVMVGLGGQVRMCDPAKALSNDTPDGC